MRKLIFVSFILLASCNGPAGEVKTSAAVTENTTEQKESRNKATALASLNGLQNNNIDEVLKNADKAMVDYGDGSMPPAKGRDTVRAMLTGWMSALQNYKGSNITTVAEGDQVFVYADWSATFKEDFMGMKTAGKTFNVKDVDIFTFNDAGNIIAHRNILPMEALLSSMERNNN